jgi:hypothetical protein
MAPAQSVIARGTNLAAQQGRVMPSLMVSLNTPFNHSNSTTVPGSHQTHLGDDGDVIWEVPLGFYQNIPQSSKAIFSTYGGTRAKRSAEPYMKAAPRFRWATLYTFTKCLDLIAQHSPSGLIDRITEPKEWHDLYDYFDGYDLVQNSAANMWELLTMTYTLMNKYKPFDRGAAIRDVTNDWVSAWLAADDGGETKLYEHGGPWLYDILCILPPGCIKQGGLFQLLKYRPDALDWIRAGLVRRYLAHFKRSVIVNGSLEGRIASAPPAVPPSGTTGFDTQGNRVNPCLPVVIESACPSTLASRTSRQAVPASQEPHHANHPPHQAYRPTAIFPNAVQGQPVYHQQEGLAPQFPQLGHPGQPPGCRRKENPIGFHTQPVAPFRDQIPSYNYQEGRAIPAPKAYLHESSWVQVGKDEMHGPTVRPKATYRNTDEKPRNTTPYKVIVPDCDADLSLVVWISRDAGKAVVDTARRLQMHFCPYGVVKHARLCSTDSNGKERWIVR